jgi:hypothetical protein
MTDPDGPAEETPRRYRNPPSEHRFRKGVSGNPRGRPRKIGALVATKIGGKPGIGFEDRIKSQGGFIPEQRVAPFSQLVI